ncbi:MAG TPA: DUF1843 domain-containing protein [Pyrinomonadaceae bacterium]|jgi:hypothetical protein|nr:DUF1843 domain-containing protein [Pyrinomonadaceae bacterium]
MPARKTTKKAAKKSTKKALRPDAGPVPPYGDPIRKAIARGDAREMKSVAASARKWMADVQAALDQLDSALKKK